MLSINVSHAKPFLSYPYEEVLCPRLERAQRELLNGGGKGDDFIGWVRLPAQYDRAEYARILAAAKKIQGDSKALVVIGIGGSYLGARGVIECLCSPNYNLKKKDTPNVYFIGNGLSSAALREVMELIGDDDFSVNVISKSGTTTEPAVAFRFFRERLEQKYGKAGAAQRIYATTDAHKGALKSLADAEGYEEFVVPDNVGGRYSVLTAVGLLPIAVAGVDTDALLAGAREMEALCEIADYTNPTAPVKRSSCSPASSRRSASWRSGGSSSTAKARARRARASSPPASISPPTCTPWVSISSRASARCWKRSSASPPIPTSSPSRTTTSTATA